MDVIVWRGREVPFGVIEVLTSSVIAVAEGVND